MRLTKDAATLKMRGRDGKEQPLASWLRGAMFSLLKAQAATEPRAAEEAQLDTSRLPAALIGVAAPDSFRFFGVGDQGIRSLTVGRPDLAALGLEAYLRVDPAELHERMTRGVEAIRREVEESGDEEAMECLEYVPVPLVPYASSTLCSR